MASVQQVKSILQNSGIDGTIFINQTQSRIEVFDDEKNIVMKIGKLGLDSNGNPMYGVAVIREDGTFEILLGSQKDSI
jgi:hypothetical protein